MKIIKLNILDNNETKFVWTEKDVKKNDYIVFLVDDPFSGEKEEVVANVVSDLKILNNANVCEEESLKEKTEDSIVRILNDQEIKIYKLNEEKAKNILKETEKLVEKLKLNMQLVSVNISLNETKYRFSFLSDDRVDFRELVKELVQKYHKKIEMRQIKEEDNFAKHVNYGKCGREVCCRGILTKPGKVHIKCAKEQNLSLAPEKIMGQCGKLMCCLQYEVDVYIDKNSKLPKVGSYVETPDGKGEVIRLDTLKEEIRVKVTDKETNETFFKRYKSSELLYQIKEKEQEKEKSENTK